MLAARTIWISIMAVASLLGEGGSWAQAQNPSNQELLDKMKAMEQRIQTLERQLEQKNAAPPPAAAPPTTPATQPLAQTSPPASAVAPSAARRARTATPSRWRARALTGHPPAVDSPSASAEPILMAMVR
jgi:hypothetical protein